VCEGEKFNKKMARAKQKYTEVEKGSERKRVGKRERERERVT